MTPSQLATLRAFYDARGETHLKFSYDPTGAAVTGRYTVPNSDRSQSVSPGRSDVQLELIELA